VSNGQPSDDPLGEELARALGASGAAGVEGALREQLGASGVVLIAAGPRPGEYQLLARSPEMPGDVADLVHGLRRLVRAHPDGTVTLEAGWLSVAFAEDGLALGLLQAQIAGTQGGDAGDGPLSAVGALVERLTGILGAAHRRALAAAAAARPLALREIALDLNADRPVQEVLDRLPDVLRPAIAFDHIGFLLGEATTDRFRLLLSHPESLFEVGGLAPTTSADVMTMPALDLAVAQYRTDAVPAGAALAEAGFRRGVSAVVRMDGEPVGFLTLSRRLNVPFEPEEERFLEVLTALLTQALTNERRLARSRAAAARSQILAEIAVLLTAGEPPSALFDRVVALLSRAMQFDVFGMGIAVEDAPALIIRSTAHPEPRRVSFEAVGMAELMAMGAPVVQVRLADTPPQSLGREYQAEGLARSAVVLLRDGDRPLGMLHVGRRPNVPLDQDEVSFLEVLGTLFAQAIGARRRLAEANRETASSRLLNQLSLELDAGEALETMFARVEPLLRRAARADHVALLVRSEEADLLRLVGATAGVLQTWKSEFRDTEVGVELFAGQGPTMVQHATGDHPVTRMRALAGAGIQRVALGVLRDHEETVGMLSVARVGDRPFSNREMEVLDVARALIAQAAAQRLRVERAERDAAEQEVAAAIAAAVARATTPGQLSTELAPVLARIIPGPTAWIGVVEGDEVTWSPGGDETLRGVMQARIRAAIESGQVVTDGPPGGVVSEAAHRFYNKLGVRRAVLTSMVFEGQPTGLLAVGTSDPAFRFRERHLRLLQVAAALVGPALARWRAAAERERERALYRLILDSLSEAVILLDERFKTTYANASGQGIIDAIDPERAAEGLEANARLLPDDVARQFVTSAERAARTRGRSRVGRDGETRWIDYELIPISDQPGTRLLAVARDVTAEVRLAEEQQRHRDDMERAARLAALGELISGVAHELNNPLTAILGFADVMAVEGVPGHDEDVAVIRKEAMRARDVVRDLLFVAAPAPVEKGEVSLPDVWAHIERIRRGTWERQGVRVEIDLSEAAAPVWGSEHQLTQVLLNLVTNAEHAVEGRPDPRIVVRARSDVGGAIIQVTDNGRGMDDATRSRVFEPFFTTRRGSGTGLGLSLSYTIVAAHDGSIEVDSAPGAGSTFTLRLPPRPDAATTPAAPAPANPAAGSSRVLVVDDEPSVRRVAQRLLEVMGHECDVAEGSADALELARQHDYELVICDYRLAGETGDAVVEGLARVAPQLVPRTAIATGATTEGRVVELIGMYGLRLIAKPYGRPQLAELLAAVRAGDSAGT
jgi:signal transduction histidine kinase/CheY-like chemotaxis protein